jgi:hypothetical protein
MFILLSITLLCILVFLAYATRPSRKVSQTTLADAQRSIARLKAELVWIDEELRDHDIGPLRPRMETNAHTIRALKRVLDEKLEVNTELHGQMWGEGLLYTDTNEYKSNSIMESFSHYNDMVWFSERMRECVALEDALLERQPRLRDSIEHMKVPYGMY